MKKKTLVPLTVAAVAALFAGNVNAKTLSPQEVLNQYGTDGTYRNNVYVIGGYIFKDSFTLKEYWMGAQSAPMTNEPVVYHFDSVSEKWLDTLNGDTEIAVPASFDVDYARLSVSEGGKIIPLTDTERIEELKALEEDAKGRKEIEYTTESWEALKDALKVENDGSTASLKNKIAVLKTAIDGLEFVNAKDLVAIKDKRAALVASDYIANTDDLTIQGAVTYNEFIQSYDSLDNSLPEDTYQNITTKIAKLNECFDKLEKASTTNAKSSLGDSITTAGSKTPGDYTIATRTPFETALADANKVSADSNSTISQINAAKTALDNAIKALVFVNRETLDARVAEARTKVADARYTTLSKNELSKKIKAVEDADEAAKTNPDVITKDSIETLIDGLDTELSHLVETECEDALNAIIKDGDTYLNKNDDANNLEYEPTSYSNYTTALTNAKNVTKKVETEYVIKDTNKEQADYEELITKLDDAISKLTFAQQKTFDDLLAEANGLVASDYDAKAWDVFQYALAKVKTENFTSNQEVKENLANLTKYMTTLRANKVEPDAKAVADFNKVLGDQVDTGNGNAYKLTESDYTPETWKEYKKVVDAAIAYNGGTEKTNSLYVSHANAMTTANNALRFKKDTLVTALENVNKEVNADTYTTYYTKASRDALAVAIESANLIMNDENPSKKDIADAVTALNTAKDALEVNDEILTKLLNEAYAEADYSVNSYAAYKTAIDNARVADNVNTSAKKIAAIKAIDAAKKLLVKSATEKALSDALLKADADYGKYDDSSFAGKYTGSSKDEYVALRNSIAKFVTAVPNAQDSSVIDKYTVNVDTPEVKDNDGNVTTVAIPVNEAIVQKAISDLSAALDKLVPSNMVSLETMVEAANVAISDKSLYTPASINRVKDKLNMDEKTHAQVASKISAIRIAISTADAANTESTGLVFSNAEALKIATEKANLDASQYDLTDINSALAMEESTYALVAKKILAINSAVAAAYKNPINLAELNGYAKMNDTGLYTDESWTKFYDEYTKIRNNGTEDSYTLVAAKIDKVKAKLDLLVSAPKKQLADLVAAEDGVRDLSAYSDAAKKTAYTDALAAAKNYLNNASNATTPGIKDKKDYELKDSHVKELNKLYKALQVAITELA